MIENRSMVLHCGACGSPKVHCGCVAPLGRFTAAGQCVVEVWQRLPEVRCIGVRPEWVSPANSVRASQELAMAETDKYGGPEVLALQELFPSLV